MVDLPVGRTSGHRTHPGIYGKARFINGLVFLSMPPGNTMIMHPHRQDVKAPLRASNEPSTRLDALYITSPRAIASFEP